MSFSYASVVETIQLSPRLRRIALRVDDPEVLAVQLAGDSAVGVYFPTLTPDGERTPPPVVPAPKVLRQWSRGDDDAVADAMRCVGMTELAGRLVDELSGGQRQRVGWPWCSPSRPR